MRDGQYRLLWAGISDSKKMKAIVGTREFRIGCHLVYTWLLPWCDDDGRMPGEPLKVLANIIPNEGFSVKEIEKMLQELTKVGLLVWYEIDGERFIQILDWERYQRIRKDRYHSSGYPAWQPTDNQSSTDSTQNCNRILSPSPTPTHSHRDNRLTDGFLKFWETYPKKKNRGHAEKAWQKIKPNDELLEVMLSAIEKLKLSNDWIKNDGQFIPYPASWLNAKGWEDEIKVVKDTW